MRRWALPALTAVTLALPLVVVAATGSATASPPTSRSPAPGLARSPELSETTRLADRRALVTGDRFYSVSAEDGSWPAAGFHTRGEMGGMFAPPVKVLDGLWFGLNGRFLPAATRFTSGWGYVRRDIPAVFGIQITRTDFVPDGLPAGLVGLTLMAPTARTVSVTVDAHSELVKSYPWGETTPSQLAYNLPDAGAFDGQNLVFTETGTPPVANAERHDYAGVVGSSLRPVAHRLAAGDRGPQDPPVICPPSGPGTPDQPDRCDDTAYGKGTGGRLDYELRLPARTPTTVWFAVAGSDRGVRAAREARDAALRAPEALLRAKVAARLAVGQNTVVDLPGDRLLERGVEWSKQNLADSVQQAHDLALRPVHAGSDYPAPVGRLAQARWIAAGFPDYPWLFGTDGEYTAFAAVAAGQFTAIEAHLRALRDTSDIVNRRSGKVVHEVTFDGSVFFGENSDAGNTDETAKFPSAVALVWRWTGDDAFRDEMYDFVVRNMKYIMDNLDSDGDGWPEGLGNVERPGMGEEKLDNAVYTVRGLRDLADMAASRGDRATADWAGGQAARLESIFERDWWFGGSANQYADSLDDPGNVPVFQRHWIGLTPLDAELVRPGLPTHPLASDEHARAVLDRRQDACYSDEFGLYHTGTGPTSAEGGNRGPSCDDVLSSVQSDREVFSLNTSIMAVAEGNYGRMGVDQQQRYTTANARIQLDPSVWEQPGAMPEIAPSPDFGANIDRRWTERSSLLQAWGTYGVLWPVVHQQLGIDPDLGRSRLSVVPQVPDGQSRISGDHVRIGRGEVAVRATREGRRLSTVVDTRGVRPRLTIGAVLPPGAGIGGVTLSGRPAAYQVVDTARGREVLVDAGRTTGSVTLVVRLR